MAQTNSLVQENHTYNTQLTQGLMTGGTISYREYQQTFSENAPGDFVNPSSAARMDVIYTQPLLQNFGISLNNRTIRVSRINKTSARELFRGQLLDLCSSVLNLYYTLAAASDELRARQRSLEIAQKFVEDTRKEIAAEAIPAIQLPPAEAELSSRRQELQIAQSTVRQQEVLLKEAISHVEDPALETAGIVLVDRIQIPDTDDLPPLRELVTTAMAKRPDVAVSKYRDQTNKMPGTICHSTPNTVAPLALACTAPDDPWPLASDGCRRSCLLRLHAQLLYGSAFSGHRKNLERSLVLLGRRASATELHTVGFRRCGWDAASGGWDDGPGNPWRKLKLGQRCGGG